MTVNELLKRIHVLHLCGGLNPVPTANRADTLQQLFALYHVWTDQDLDRHKSHLAMYVAPPLTPVSAFRASVATFPGIGYRTSVAVEHAFQGSLQRAVGASVDEWAQIPVMSGKGRVRRLGMAVALRITKFVKGRS
jgi:hypothetical protein